MLIDPNEQNRDIRRNFFTLVFGNNEGYICLADAPKSKEGWSQAAFHYPEQLDALLDWIDEHLNDEHHLYYSPMLYSTRHRLGANVKTCPVLWSDLDDASPTAGTPLPSIVTETSEGRWQALWLLATPAEPKQAAQASRRLAYEFGGDPSGWDLSQLLRIPITVNPKYLDTIVSVVKVDPKNILDIDTLDLPPIPYEDSYDKTFPEAKIAAMDYQDVLRKYARKAVPAVFRIHAKAPSNDYSSALWNLENLCAEAGMDEIEMFLVAESSAVNKYKRDNRPRTDLWHEVCKAAMQVRLALGNELLEIKIPPILTDDERDYVTKLPPTFVDEYVAWAKTRTDASWQYHEAGGFMILSTVLADSIRLNLSNTKLVPNLWFMLLGDTTTTRKTTAMEMAMELLGLVMEDALLATDASLEGLMTALSTRQSRSSVFWRDEFAGMLEAMKKKDYYAGMSATLARLYDGKHEVRVLKAATYEVHNPVFLMFCGGIKSRIIDLLDVSYITDGFLPRFVFITAEANMSDLRPLTLSTEEDNSISSDLAERLSFLRSRYDVQEQIMLGAQKLAHKGFHLVGMTQEALDRYNQLESSFIVAGQGSSDPDVYVPVLDRLAKSGLRVATLLAAERQEPPQVTVELQDVLQAIRYIDGWLPHTLWVIENAGKAVSEKRLDQAMALIRKGKDTRSSVMRSMHLMARDADIIFDTLEQRGMITRHKNGKKEALYPTHG